MPSLNPTFADFFAGIGLAEIGFRRKHWRCLFANDFDSKKLEMYRYHFRRGYVPRNVHDLGAWHIPNVDLWWASFPCTDVSLAGYRKGLAGDQTGALLAVLRLLREKDGQRPPLVVLENVTGFITSHGGDDLEETIRQLNGIGYSCDAFVVDAIHFVPQSRPRLFIVGIYDQPADESGDVIPALSSRPESLKISRLTEFVAANLDLDWRILEIPPPPNIRKGLSSVIEELPEDSRYWWSLDRVDYLVSQMSVRHRAELERLKGQPVTSHATVYRRMRGGRSMAELRTDGVAGCLRTPRGGSSRQILVEVGGGNLRARYMTPIEYARLMGAPRYRFGVSDNQAYFGFGDGVCVQVVEWIVAEVINPLNQLIHGRTEIPEYASQTV